ncbi:VOC family protein [Paracoccus aerodenitrificans]|uniref:VOC family protein n=1 Tax=Paracoccus aerodenitrificans TaxID=3017781 RepID=UPI0022F0714A|nr:VOC family protein [Paracoccus aerodenitrificans]WBU63743.1 glyoxalase [Paracoccus aerodenitrificans]
MMQIDHVQLAIPEGSENLCAPFWIAAGFTEIAKPEKLRARGGAWYRSGSAELHLGVEADFRPAAKAHPAFGTDEIDAIADRLAKARAPVRWDEEIAGRRRFFTEDPCGNRVEFLEAG